MCMPRLRIGALLGAALFACGVVLLVVAAGTSFYYQWSIGNTVGLGMFKICSNDDKPEHCSKDMIDSKCNLPPLVVGIFSISTGSLPNCDLFNAMRAFLVMAIIIGGIGFLSMLYSAVGKKSRSAVHTAGTCALISAILAMISFAMGISYHDKNNSGFGVYLINESSYGHSEKLLIAGWVTELVGGAVYSLLAKS